MRRRCCRGWIQADLSAFWLGVFLLCPPAYAGGVVTHYEINAQIAPEQGTLRATAASTLVAPENGLREMRFLLNRALTSRDVRVAFEYDLRQ